MAAIKAGFCTKRAQGKKRSSPKNWKERYFVLTRTELSYWDKEGGPENASAQKKGGIPTCTLRAAEEVRDPNLERLHLFQVVHGSPSYTLYVQARDAADRAAWLAAIREQLAGSPLRGFNYHPAAYDGKAYPCCGAGQEREGCLPCTLIGLPEPALSSTAAAANTGFAFSYPDVQAALATTPSPLVPPVAPGSTIALPPALGPSADDDDSESDEDELPPPPPLAPKPAAAAAAAAPMGRSESGSSTGSGGARASHTDSPAARNSSGGGGMLSSSSPPRPWESAAPVAEPTTPMATKRPPPPPPAAAAEPTKQRQMRVMYSYVASQPGDLSIEKDELITILEEKPNWWKAQNKHGQTGFVPSNYLSELGMESEPWFRGKISRAEASTLLQMTRQEGCFLVRESESQPGEYTLTVSHGDGVRHYRIQHVNNEYFVNEGHRFESIPKMIEYHKLNSGGIVTRLRRAIADANAPVSVGLGYGVLELDRHEFSLGRELGSGQFGMVQQATYRNGRQVAIKMMKEGKMSADDFISEAVVMRDLTHPHLVQLLGVCTRDGPLWIVVELVSKGCLLNYLRDHHELRREPAILHMMTVHIASAMSYLESKGFIHRDLAARNCLLGDDYVVKVADFGLARFVVDNEYISSEGTQFPIKWSAPEVINFTRFSTKSDVWSFGITIWEIWSFGQIPYAAHRNHEIADLLASGFRMSAPVDAPQPAYQLMRDCWHQDPECRPTFAEIFMRLKENKEDYS